jgi:hypothetical protein
MRIFNFHAPWIDGCGVLIYTESVKKRYLENLKKGETEMDSYVTGQTVNWRFAGCGVLSFWKLYFFKYNKREKRL